MKPYRQYTDEVLSQLKQEEMDILVKFDKLCKKHNINYFATGGTLLGVIRHKGFIPWDDDIDIGMLREEYDRFLEIPASEYDDLGLYAPEINPGGYYSFVTKLYDKNSEFETPITAAGSGHKVGIFIELFPFDNVTENSEELKKQIKKVNHIKNLYTTVTCNKIIVFDDGILGLVKKLVKLAIKIYANIFNLTSKKLADKYVNTVRNTKKSKMVYAFSDVGHLVQREWISETVRVPFEDIEIEIPKYYQGVLEGLYGKTYMQLPPVEKRWNQATEKIVFKDGKIFS